MAEEGWAAVDEEAEVTVEADAEEAMEEGLAEEEPAAAKRSSRTSASR